MMGKDTIIDLQELPDYDSDEELSPKAEGLADYIRTWLRSFTVWTATVTPAARLQGRPDAGNAKPRLMNC
jgi:hypothetical protein